MIGTLFKNKKINIEAINELVVAKATIVKLNNATYSYKEIQS